MDYQTYTNNVQNIMMMYQELITQALTESNSSRLDMLVRERDEKLDELRRLYFDKAYTGSISYLKESKNNE